MLASHSFTYLIPDLEVVNISKIGVEYPTRHSSLLSKFIEELSIDLVKTFVDINRASSYVLAIEPCELAGNGCFLPCILSSLAGDSGVYGVAIPGLYPIFQVPISAGGPFAIQS